VIPFRILNNQIIDLEHIKEEDINIEHIAHALTMQCRYNGQIPKKKSNIWFSGKQHYTIEFYSVAQHSILVADILYHITSDKQVALCGLLHDAAEAYIGDIVAPLKNRLPFVKEVESRIMSRILDKYNIKHVYIKNKELIDRIDHRLYDLEVGYFFGGKHSIYGYVPENNMYTIQRAFMICFNWYNKG